MTDRGRTRPSASARDGSQRAQTAARPDPEPSRGDRAPEDPRRLKTIDAGDRGQTVQDFAIGASVFLLTIAFIFAFIPTLFTPFDDNVAPGLESQADRVADAVVADASIENRPNRLARSAALSLISQNNDALQDEFGLPSTTQINITVTPMAIDRNRDVIEDGGDRFDGGQEYRGRPAATVSRIVVIEGVDACSPGTPADGDNDPRQACRLTVRVW